MKMQISQGKSSAVCQRRRQLLSRTRTRRTEKVCRRRARSHHMVSEKLLVWYGFQVMNACFVARRLLVRVFRIAHIFSELSLDEAIIKIFSAHYADSWLISEHAPRKTFNDLFIWHLTREHTFHLISSARGDPARFFSLAFWITVLTARNWIILQLNLSAQTLQMSASL